MSAATISTNKKLNDGTLLSIGGVTAEDFEANLVALLGREGADGALAEIKRTFVAAADDAGWGFPPVPPYQPQQQGPGFQAAPAQQAAATSTPVCAGHGQPAIWRQKKDNSGGFFKCQVNDSIISEFGKPDQIKPFCPAAKPR